MENATFYTTGICRIPGNRWKLFYKRVSKQPLTQRVCHGCARILITCFMIKGKVRSIGASNFSVLKLEEILQTAEIVPAVNQASRLEIPHQYMNAC
jgi:hypothetical protein